MVILGIDPGTSSIGYSIVDTGTDPRIRAAVAHSRPAETSGVAQVGEAEARILHAGVFRLDRIAPGERLIALHTGVKKLIGEWHPEAFAIEKLFFAKNTKTAMAVSESRGALLLTAALAGIRVFEYTPLEIKKTVTGDGRADKAQMEKMIRLMLPDAVKIRTQDDTFDAIAVAYTCYLKEFRNPYARYL